MSNKFYPVIFLTVIVLVCVAILMGLNALTSEIILARQQSQLKELLAQTYNEMTEYNEENGIYVILKDDEIIGYSFLSTANGYGGDIKILVSLENDYSIKKVEIISQTETPGLGDKIVDSSFTDKFIGLDAQEVALSQEGGSIDAISGATVSSKAVTDSIRNTILEKIQNIK